MKPVSLSLLLLAAATVPLPAAHAADKPTADKPAETSPAQSADPFEAGSVWRGQRHFKKSGGKGQPWSLHIKKREGEKFSGFIVLRDTAANKVEIEVEGSAPSDGTGYVGFATTEAKGDARQRFTGSIKNDIVELEFKGRSLTGENVEGTAGLSRKK